MKLLEYEAKGLLKAGGVPVPQSFMAGESPAFLPAVLKSQVPVGGRGKAGGVVVVQDKAAYIAARQTISKLSVKGFLPQKILAEELLTISKEYYLSLVVDKPTATIELVANIHGGVEVEENDSKSFLKIPLTSHNDFDAIGQQLADHFDVSSQTFALQDLVERLYKIFVHNDALLLEINPLVLTTNDQLVAGDCKMELDDAAHFRHLDWQFEAEKAEANFVTLDTHGTVATIANGAGLAMATVDAVADAGMQPANFLDIGGGANEASVLAAFQRIMGYPNVRVIIINIFAGITRCDEMARAIIAARAQLADLPPLAVRLAGTNYEQAAELLQHEGVQIHASLDEAIKAAKELA